MRIRPLLRVVLLLLPTITLSGAIFGQEEHGGQSKPVREQPIREQSSAELLSLLETALPPSRYSKSDDKPNRERILIELIRRNDPAAITPIRKLAWLNKQRLANEETQLEKIRKEDSSSEKYKAQYGVVARLQSQLDLFTAIRRLERAPDPLAIEIVETEKAIVGTTRNGLSFDLRIKNVDINRQPIWFVFGGDYRGGRQARWRIHVWDDSGQRVPARDHRSFMGGGVYSEAMLEHGESWETQVDVLDYVERLKPGNYTCKIMYHNLVTIADVDDKQLQDLILVESPTISFEIGKGPQETVSLSDREQQEAVDLVAKLNGHASLTIVYGDYAAKLRLFLDPSSPPGRLRELGRKAVPAIIAGLEDKKLSNEKRAWLLSLLDSILDERIMEIPEMSDVFGSYSARSVSGYSSSRGGEISREKQQALIERWIQFRDDYIEVIIDESE